MAVGQQAIDERTSNEPGSAGHECTHSGHQSCASDVDRRIECGTAHCVRVGSIFSNWFSRPQLCTARCRKRRKVAFSRTEGCPKTKSPHGDPDRFEAFPVKTIRKCAPYY